MPGCCLLYTSDIGWKSFFCPFWFGQPVQCRVIIPKGQKGDVYKRQAWKMLKASEKAWGFMLPERETGGRDGGGSTLTPQAIRLLEAYDAFMACLLYTSTGMNSAFQRVLFCEECDTITRISD